MKTITINGFHIAVIETENGYTGTVSTDTQSAVFVDHLKTKKDVDLYLAKCEMVFSMIGKKQDKIVKDS